MKKITVKRLVYTDVRTHEVSFGAEEYNGYLSDDNILGTIFTVGKHDWYPRMRGIYQLDQDGNIIYHITVETFIQYEKTWIDYILDKIKRI